MVNKTAKKNASTRKNPATPPTRVTANEPARSAKFRRRVATSLTDGLLLNAMTAVSWSRAKDDRDKTDAIDATWRALKSAGGRVEAGNLGAAESLLMAQAVALNA